MCPEFERIGICSYCGGHTIDDEPVQAPVVYYRDSVFSGWVHEECKELLIAEEQSRNASNKRRIDDEFRARAGIVQA